MYAIPVPSVLFIGIVYFNNNAEMFQDLKEIILGLYT